jgi:peptidoglycan/LPS O-acetylase OafA/YrhL
MGSHGKLRVRFEALDSWRGIAALVVVLFHAQIVGHIRDIPIVRSGETFVDFFFVLSGFVIAHAYADRLADTRSFREFLFLRLGRLYPLHFFMLMLFLAFEVLKSLVPGLGNPSDPAFSGANEPSTLLANLLLLHSMGLNSELSWNTPSWSISAEFIAYVCFGFAVLVFRWRLAWALAALAAAAALALATLADLGMETTAQLGGVRAIYGFSLGALLYMFAGRSIVAARSSDSRSGARLDWTLVEFAAVPVAVFAITAASQTRLSYAVPLVFCAVIAIFAVERGLISRVLKLRPLLFLGAISYSLYLTHMFVQLRFMNVARLLDKVSGTSSIAQIGHGERYGGGIDTGSLFGGDLLMLLMLACVIGMSWLSYRLIEVPGRAFFRRLAHAMFRRVPHPVLE